MSGPPRGTVQIAVVNAGHMEHNLAIKDSTGKLIGATPTFMPGDGPQSLTVTLQAGTYTFYCALPGHAQRGQTIQVIVQ